MTDADSVLVNATKVLRYPRTSSRLGVEEVIE